MLNDAKTKLGSKSLSMLVQEGLLSGLLVLKKKKDSK
jgi:hypothetical protein